MALINQREIDKLTAFVEDGGLIRKLINKSLLDTRGIAAEKLLLYLYEKYVVDVRKESIAKTDNIEDVSGITYDILLKELKIRGRQLSEKGEEVIFNLPEKDNCG